MFIKETGEQGNLVDLFFTKNFVIKELLNPYKEDKARVEFKIQIIDYPYYAILSLYIQFIQI